MSFIDNIKECFCSAEFPKEPLFRAVLFGEKAGYFENVCGIVSYSAEQIVLCLKRGTLTIKGEELFVKKYCAGDVMICGKIKAIERT